MNTKKEKFIYWLIGLGSGLILSGMVMTGIGLSLLPKAKTIEAPPSVVEKKIDEQQNGAQKVAKKETAEQQNDAQKAVEEELGEQQNDALKVEKEKTGEQQNDAQKAVEEKTGEQQNGVQKAAEEKADEQTKVAQYKEIEDEAAQSNAQEEKRKYKKVYIAQSENAESICKLLETEELIEDATDFLGYIQKQGKDRKLRSGEFNIPEKCPYEELLNILLRKST